MQFYSYYTELRSGVTLVEPSLNLFIFCRKSLFDWQPIKKDTQTYLSRFLTYPPPPPFYKRRILNIFDIFRLQLGQLVYEAVNGIGPSNKVIKFHRFSDIHCHNTRHADQGNLYINSARTTRFGFNCGLLFPRM